MLVLAFLAPVLFFMTFMALYMVVPADASLAVHSWWAVLSTLAIVNPIAWMIIMKKAPAFRRPQLLLSLGYVLGCGFRSLLPRADVQRICLVDSWISSVAVGRSVATIAELCFAAQLALILREYSKEAGSPLGDAFSRLIFPLLVLAECFSWFGVISTNYIGNTIEESLWTLSALLLACGLASLLRVSEGRQRRLLQAAIVGCGLYICFMISVDVKMYATRWLADEAAGKIYLSFADGFRDVSSRWHVTFDIEQWRTEIPWMTAYFSFAVWTSIGICRLGRFTVSPSRQ